MEKEILELEALLARLKDVYRKQKKEQYENKLHKDFNVGDIVTNGEYIGTVRWTENKVSGYGHDRGYMGIDLISGSRGFLAPVKRDDYKLVADSYYTDLHDISLQLTGLEIEELKYSLKIDASINKAKDTVLGVLDLVHNKV